jgi:hypothetical protein
MYQAIVLGLGVLLVVGGGYLIQNTDKQGVILASVSTPAGTSTVKNKITSLPGTYVCDVGSGCQNPRILTVYETGEVKMNTNFDNGVEILDEVGTWTMNQEGRLILLLTGTSQETYPDPRTLSVKYVSSTTLSGIGFDPSKYKDFKNPVFLKQGDPTEDGETHTSPSDSQ